MNQFKNKVLYIESNEMLEEVRELIEEKEIKICEGTFWLSGIKEWNYLYYCFSFNEFSTAKKNTSEYEITLEEFKELLKQ